MTVGRLIALDSSNATILTSALSGERLGTFAVIADLVGTSEADLLLGTTDPLLSLIEGKPAPTLGSVRGSLSLPAGTSAHVSRIGDLDGDGTDDLAVTLSDGSLYVVYDTRLGFIAPVSLATLVQQQDATRILPPSGTTMSPIPTPLSAFSRMSRF